jgi:uncharacterized membrane protein
MRPVNETNLRRIGAGLALVGIGIATYITIADAGGGAPACIAGGHGCQTVADSSYSHLAGIPVSAIGIGGYLLLLGAFAARGDAARFTGLLAALIGFGFSLYLTYLELFVIDAICQWCVASAVVITVLLVVAAWRAVVFSGAELRLHGSARSTGAHEL